MPFSVLVALNNTANEIVDRTVRRLGVHVTAIGFDNEADMVKSLAATNRSQLQTCFTHGAGKIELGKSMIWQIAMSQSHIL